MWKIYIAYETIALLRSRATAGTKQMTAVPGLGPETSALVTLGAAVDLGELLTVVRTLAPTTARARFVAWRTFAFGVGKIVQVHPLGPLARDDLVPVNGAHVAQIVVVDHAHVAGQYVYNKILCVKQITGECE